MKRKACAVGMADDRLSAEADAAVIQKGRQARRRKRLRWGLPAACLALFLALGTTAYAASPGFRETLADVLHLKIDETTYIGKSSSSSGITMTVESAHVCRETAVVMLTFQKNDGASFGNGMIRYYPNRYEREHYFSSGLTGGIVTKLSEDSKTLFCYYTWSFPDSFTDRTVILKVSALICNQSQVDGTVWPDDLLRGDWRVRLDLIENKDNTKTVVNPDLTKTIFVFDQVLQVNSVSMSDMLLIASTTTLSQHDITEEELQHRLLSNTFSGSSAYFDVFGQLVYKDGSTSENISFCRDCNGDMVAWFPGTIPMGDVAQIRIGDVSIPVW